MYKTTYGSSTKPTFSVGTKYMSRVNVHKP